MASDVLGEFIKALRAADVPVSTAETLDAMKVAELLGYQDRPRLRAGLGAALAKSEDHRRLFDVCFDRFFRMSGETPSSRSGETPSVPPETDNGQPGDGAGGSAAGDGASLPEADLGDLARQLLANDQSALASSLANAGQQAGASRIRVITQKGLVGRRMYVAMGGERLDQDIRALEALASLDAQSRANALRQGRDRLRDDIRQSVARQFLLHGGAESRQLREQTMREVALRDLREFREVETVIRRMARKLIALNSRRRKQRRRGILDARRTVVSSIGTDAVPWRTYWRQRHRIRPRLYVVCDVSNSVSAASGFLMMFLAAVSDVLPRTRTFVFSSRFAEITRELQGDVDQGVINRIMDQWAGPGTDYAGMLSDFLSATRGELNQRSTVIILGDARNNDMPPRQELLAEIQGQAGAVLWLNPESELRWNSGDSVMASYQPYCRHVASCATLARLERFVSVMLADMRRI